MVTDRVNKMPSFIVMDVLEEANRLEREGKEIIHLEIGEPDFDTPEFIKEEAIKALREGVTHYTDTQGIPELRLAIAAHYHSKYGVNVDPDNVIVTLGTSPALFMALSALVEKGDEVIITDPGYACYKNMIEFVSGKPVPVPVYDDEGYLIDPERLKKSISKKTRAIIINSPANPTGTTLTRENMEEISHLAEKYGFYIISDEIYHGLNYSGKDISALEVSQNAIVINGFSKTYAMTGWRLGYLIAPRKVIEPLKRVHQNLFICAASFVQKAAVKAIEEGDDFVKRVVNEYRQRRDYLLSELRRLGFEIRTTPQGAFYIMAGIRSFNLSSIEFSRRLLYEAGVATTPGIDFGANGEGYIRFSYATSLENLKKAVFKIEKFVEGRTETR
jgi:aspartate/methionine/tyrosine aminotransferase